VDGIIEHEAAQNIFDHLLSLHLLTGEGQRRMELCIFIIAQTKTSSNLAANKKLPQMEDLRE